MRLVIRAALLFFGLTQLCCGQTNGNENVPATSVSAAASSANSYTVFGATPHQEAFIRSQIQIMLPAVLPPGVFFVPHWKYIDNARIFQLHVPAGYTSAMFTHLPSRTIFIDVDRYVNDDSLAYWMAHELGHLAANSPKENDAEKIAREYRKRTREAQQDGHHQRTNSASFWRLAPYQGFVHAQSF
jgi:hypothetical protein